MNAVTNIKQSKLRGKLCYLGNIVDGSHFFGITQRIEALDLKLLLWPRNDDEESRKLLGFEEVINNDADGVT